MTHTALIIPFINDLLVILPAAAAGWGYYKGATRSRFR